MPLRYFSPLLGHYRRRKGYYDGTTARRFGSGWKKSGNPGHLLAYALFRRDLGERLPGRLVGPLTDALPRLSPAQRRLALGLIAERSPEVLAVLPAAMLADGAGMPSIAPFCTDESEASSGAAKIHREQDAWRSEFARDLRRALAGDGVAVIGNAAGLLNSGLGGAIDSHEMVIRFNHFMGASAPVRDVGGKIDVWVVAPGYDGPLPESVGRIVMTGPDMRYRMADWSRFMPLVERGVPLLTVPLDIWRTLVRQLEAPPSAGVLVLSWLHALNAGWEGLAMAGIGSGIGKGRYHATLSRHVASSRHAWQREADLVRAWRRAGLRDCLDRLGEPR